MKRRSMRLRLRTTIRWWSRPPMARFVGSTRRVNWSLRFPAAESRHGCIDCRVAVRCQGVERNADSADRARCCGDAAANRQCQGTDRRAVANRTVVALRLRPIGGDRRPGRRCDGGRHAIVRHRCSRLGGDDGTGIGASSRRWQPERSRFATASSPQSIKTQCARASAAMSMIRGRWITFATSARS